MCRAFEIAMENFRNKVPDSVYTANADTLRDKFLNGFLDTSLPCAVENALSDLDIMDVSDFRVIVLKLKEAEQEKDCKHHLHWSP